VSQRALTLPEFAPFPPPNPSQGSADSPPLFPAPARRLEFDRLPESITANGNCLKGAGFALLFEVVAALSIYGGWLLWKVLR
jgi:hypothetical protein